MDEDVQYTTGQDACGGDECWTISLAGHSLGGGIASIVGSTLGISVSNVAIVSNVALFLFTMSS